MENTLPMSMSTPMALSTPFSASPADLAFQKSTPRSAAAAAACAAATQQSLPPEALLVLVVLDHPIIRAKWSSVILPFLDTIIRRFSSLHPGSRLMIGSVIYRLNLDCQSKVRSRSTLVKLPFVTGQKFLDTIVKGEEWLERYAPSQGRNRWDLGDMEGSKEDQSFQGSGHAAAALDAFVGVGELFDMRDGGALTIHNPIAPKRPPIMARHIVHLTTEDNLMRLDLESPPLFNANMSNDDQDITQVCTKLAKKGASISSCAIRDIITPELSEPRNGFKVVHDLFTSKNSLPNDDVYTIFPSTLRSRLSADCTVLITGLSMPTTGTRKRSRTEEAAEVDDPINAFKRSKSGSISRSEQPFSAAAAAASLPAQAAALQQKLPKLDLAAATKIIFLKQQQEIMFRNLSLIAGHVLKVEKEGGPKLPAPGMNRAYLEQLRNQLIAQQQGLRMLIQKIVTGNQVPDFNICFHSLLNIDKEAKEMGVYLGGPTDTFRKK